MSNPVDHYVKEKVWVKGTKKAEVGENFCRAMILVEEQNMVPSCKVQVVRRRAMEGKGSMEEDLSQEEVKVGECGELVCEPLKEVDPNTIHNSIRAGGGISGICGVGRDRPPEEVVR